MNHFLILLLLASAQFQSRAQTDDSIYTYVDHQPSYPGGLESLHSFIKTNMKYPQRAKDMGVEGDVYISVVINKEGWPEHPAITRSVFGALDSEALRIVSMMPPWNPAALNGKDVSTRCTIPVSFRLAPKEQIYNYVEQMPTPTFDIPHYLGQTIKYPAAARNNNITGRVIVKFVVDENGDIQDPRVVNNIDPSLANEAVRVVGQMPKWNPGKQDGKAVKTYFTLPISFKIEK